MINPEMPRHAQIGSGYLGRPDDPADYRPEQLAGLMPKTDGLLTSVNADLDRTNRTMAEAEEILRNLKTRVFGAEPPQNMGVNGAVPTPVCMSHSLADAISLSGSRASTLLSLAEELNSRL